MDALILNAGHSQLEEQLKIAAACGVAERQSGSTRSRDITAVIATDDSDEVMTMEDNPEGLSYRFLQKQTIHQFLMVLLALKKNC